MPNLYQFFYSIPGPEFLLYNAIYGIIVIYAAHFIIQRDSTRDFEVPEPTKLSPLDIAVLRNGVKGAIVHSIFTLWLKKAMVINASTRQISVQSLSESHNGFNELEKAIYDYALKPKLYRHIFKRDVVKPLDNMILLNRKKLEDFKLIPDLDYKEQVLRKFGLSLLVLITPGLFKLYMGLEHDKPVMFLIFSLIGLSLWLYLQLKPNKVRITSLGKRTLKLCEERFKWLKTSKKVNELLQDENLLYGIATFGVAAFMSTHFADLIKDVAALDKKANSGSGSGCSGCVDMAGGFFFMSSDSGCGGGCSGGGCSGCSGGCGGCGGCGGD